jgi:kynurenine 3-monooxygenase
MQHGERANYRQEFLAWGYKELRIPAGPGGTFAMEKNALHVWPRGDRMLLAIPNRDGSFTCTCILPFQGEDSFASLRSDVQVRSFMHAQFGDVASLMPTLIDDFTGHRTAEFVTIRTSPWHYKDRVVLIGDACHAVYPFYGQGMNAAFEDCSELNQCLGRHEEDWGAAFEAFYGLRKRNTDVLADLSRENFVELRDTVRSPILVTRKKVTAEIHRRFPKVCVPLYTLVTHTTMPYAEALARAQRQDRMLRWLGLDVVVLVGATALALRHPVQTLARTGSRFPRVAPVRFRVSHWTRSLPRSPLVAAPVRQGPLARGTWRDMQQIQSLAQLHGQPVASTLRAVQVWNHRALDGVEPIDATLPAPATLRDARPALPGSAAAR